MKLPAVVSLVMCERIGPDPVTGRPSLFGLFQSLRFRTFPSGPQRFHIYAALFDGDGEGTMELSASRLETEEDIYSYRTWVAFPGRGRVVNLMIPVERFVFPAPGRYGFMLRFDGNELASRYLDIFREGE